MISVIVPIYNSEKYLNKCIQSILGQTYIDFELILVDDGSTDRSGIICDKYAKNDNRVIVMHRQNGGPSIARNEASLIAKGEYITFIDSDDYVMCDYLETLLASLHFGNADISAVLMKEISENDDIVQLKCKGKIIKINGREALLNVLYQKDLDTTPCGMLFKKEIVIANPFPAGRYHEDDFTMFKYFEHAKIVCINRKIKYFYVQHDTSIMHRKSKQILMDEIDAANNLVNYFESKDKELLRAAQSKKFSNYCQIIIKNSKLKHDNLQIYREIEQYLKKERFQILFDKKTRVKNKIAAFIMLIGLDALRVISIYWK